MLGLIEEHNKNICKGRKRDGIRASRIPSRMPSRGPQGSSFSNIDIVEDIAGEIDKTSEISVYKLGSGNYNGGVVDCKSPALAKKILDALKEDGVRNCHIHNGKTILFPYD